MPLVLGKVILSSDGWKNKTAQPMLNKPCKTDSKLK